jgi:hypothetical protein
MKQAPVVIVSFDGPSLDDEMYFATLHINSDVSSRSVNDGGISKRPADTRIARTLQMYRVEAVVYLMRVMLVQTPSSCCACNHVSCHSEHGNRTICGEEE